MDGLSERARQMIDQGRTEELRAQVGSLGSRLVLLSFYAVRVLGEQVARSLREVGMRMRLLEVARLYMDGGASLDQFVNEVAECARQLDTLT